MFSFWMLAFVLDLKVTLSCDNFLKYESNVLFKFSVIRFGLKWSIVIQTMVESGFAFLAGVALSSRPDLGSTMAVLSIFGLAHLVAWRSNVGFLHRARC